MGRIGAKEKYHDNMVVPEAAVPCALSHTYRASKDGEGASPHPRATAACRPHASARWRARWVSDATRGGPTRTPTAGTAILAARSRSHAGPEAAVGRPGHANHAGAHGGTGDGHAMVARQPCQRSPMHRRLRVHAAR